MVFENLHPKIQKLIKKKGWKGPSLPQEKAIPPLLNGENILLMANTGFGKTESGMLPIFSKWLEEKPKPTSILYITPLKSLNRDMFDRLLWWTNEIGMETGLRHGDTSNYERRKQAQFPVDLMITTPETLQAILPGTKLRKHLRKVKHVIIDEVHELAESKRGTQLSLALERLKRVSSDFQIICLSATVGSPDEVAKFFSGGKKIKTINAFSEKKMSIVVDSPKPTDTDKRISEKIFISPEITSRIRKIEESIKNKRSTLVFTNTREASEVLSSRLRSLHPDFKHSIHHSSLSKDFRIQAEKGFKDEELKCLIATSSLELGIDIGSVDQVIQYMSPRQVTKLVQRVGRSGHRIGEKSTGVIISSDPDDILESVVIARRAVEGELERTKFNRLSYDVLAHQTVGLALDEYGPNFKGFYETFSNSRPYKNLSKKYYNRLLQFLYSFRLFWLDARVKRNKKSWKYYYENLSTIPDTFSYRVIDNVESKEVGVLDEEFVAEHGKVGTTFIEKGRPWKILSIDSGRVYVEPVEDIESAIPAWEGELIPVPKEVAEEVAFLRRNPAELDKYPLTKEAKERVTAYLNKQKKYGIPDNRVMLLEEGEEFVVIHSPFGTLVNETLSKFLGALLTTELGHSIAIKSDPYRIMLKGVDAGKVESTLKENDSEDMEITLENTMSRMKMFKWRFLHVTKRMGILNRRVRWDKINLNKIIQNYEATPVFWEARNEVLLDKMDIPGAKEVIDRINSGDLTVKKRKGLSPIAKAGVEHQFQELMGPKKPEKEIFSLFKDRLMKTKVKLVCMRCGKFLKNIEVGVLEDDPICPHCESRFIAVLKPHEDERLIKKHVKGKPGQEEEKRLKRYRNSADLVLTYGKKVIIALAGRGVGPETAIKVLAKQHKGDDFLRDILDAERQYTRTKKYWK